MAAEPVYVSIIDRETRAVAASFELWLVRAHVAERLGRAPDVSNARIVSWGRVRPEEVERLIDLYDEGNAEIDEPDPTRGDWHEMQARYAERPMFVTIHWRNGDF